jgi:hypothetical protein
MLYGVYVRSGDENSKTQMRRITSSDANLLFHKGCEAVFVCETDAYGYGYEQSQMRGIDFERNVIDRI